MSQPAQPPTQPASPSQVASSDYAGRPEANELEVARNASKLFQNPVKFNQWASSVQLDTTIREEDLPETLQSILRDSWTVPGWVLNEEAPQYERCPSQFGGMIPALSLAARTEPNVTSDDKDKDLSLDVYHCIDNILSISSHDSALCTNKDVTPSEADRRLTVDYMFMRMLDLRDRENSLYRLECTLQLPRTSPMIDYETRVDSACFVKLRFNYDAVGSHSTRVERACSSLGRQIDDGFRHLLHWTNEYERDQERKVVTRQVQLGLVSGIYQRRAYGCPDQFVFGIAHHTSSCLDVLAATWDLPKNSQAEGDKISDSKAVAKAAGGAPKVLAEQDKIVVYRLGAFDMGTPLDMLRLFLIMRSARKLVAQYKDTIQTNLPKRVAAHVRNSSSFYDWPSPPKPQPPPSDSNSASKKRKLNHDPKYSLDAIKEEDGQQDSSHDQEVGAFRTAGPSRLADKYVEVLGKYKSGGKVVGYIGGARNN